MIDFSIEFEFKKKLDWMNSFVCEECEMVDLFFFCVLDMYDVKNSNVCKIVCLLQQQVKDQELWVCYLGFNLGGFGYG